MRFAVTNTYDRGYEVLMSYKPILAKYSLEIVPVEYDGETYELLYITINSLTDLLSLKKELEKDIILCEKYYDKCEEGHTESTIRISDGYRYID